MRPMFLLLALAFAAQAAEPPLRVELQASPLAVKFINAGKEPIRILKPVDGSEWCWVMPHYKLTVIDDRDREAAFAPRCKLYGTPYFDTRWPHDYIVTIRPGDSYTHSLSHNHSLRTEGTYRVRFEYRFEPKVDGLPGSPDTPYPPGLWHGSAVSNTVEVKLKPNG